MSCREAGNAQTAVPRGHADADGQRGTHRAFGGEVLRECRRARQWQGLVRNVADDVLAGLRGSSSVAAVDVRTPGLEEIRDGA